MLKKISLIIILNCVVMSNAFAEQADPKAGISGQAIMLAVLLGGMYFLMIRPQNKRVKEHRNLLASIVKDDEVVTSGGLLGKVSKVSEHFFTIIIAEGVEVTIQKQAVANLLPKGTIKSA